MTPARTPGEPAKDLLLLGGTSETGLAILAALAAPPETEILLARRDQAALEAAGKTLPYQVRTYRYDATETAGHDDFIRDVFADGPVDVVISAAGVLIPQPTLDQNPLQAALLVDTNFTSHVTTLLGFGGADARPGVRTIVVLVVRGRGPAAQGQHGVRSRQGRPGMPSRAAWPTPCTAAACGYCSSGRGSSPGG